MANTVILPKPIRLLLDYAAPTEAIVDLNTGGAPVFVAGDDLQFDIGLAEEKSLLTGLTQSSAGGIAYITFNLWRSQSDQTNTPLMAAVAGTASTTPPSSFCSPSINTALTTPLWNSGSLQSSGGAANAHVSFVFPNAYTNISLGGSSSQTYWMRFSMTTNDTTAKLITLYEGSLNVIAGPSPAAVTPPVPSPFRLFNVNGVVVPQLLDPVTLDYHTLSIYNAGNGVRTLQLSDQGY